MILISQNRSGGSAALTQSRIKASERAFSAVADNGDTHRKEFGYGKRKRLKFRYDKVYTRVTDATLSLASLNRMRRTPWVARPREGTDFKGRRMTWPFSEIMMTSFFTVSPVCLGSKTNPATISPVLAVTFAVLTPEPPRLCRR